MFIGFTGPSLKHTDEKPWGSVPDPGHRGGGSQPGGVAEDDDEVEILEAEEVEAEVLVEDFDGECCRTYPFNHSKILRYRGYFK